ncbi:MAG: hypothetical protein V3W07_02625 [Syntrophobacteria bacterium]
MGCRRQPNSFLLTKSLVLLMVSNHFGQSVKSKELARIFHESLAATTDMVVLPGVLGCRFLRRTVQVRLGTNPLRLPGGTPIFVVSRQQFMKYPG